MHLRRPEPVPQYPVLDLLSVMNQGGQTSLWAVVCFDKQSTTMNKVNSITFIATILAIAEAHSNYACFKQHLVLGLADSPHIYKTFSALV